MWKLLPSCIQTAVSSTEIREAFKVFDRDGNGFISKQELGMAMRSLGYMPNEVELEVIIQRLDIDGRLLWPSGSSVWHLCHHSVCLLQVTVRLGSRNSSRCWVPSWVLLGCLTSSTEQILIQSFGRYRMCWVSRPHHPHLLKGLLSHSGCPKGPALCAEVVKTRSHPLLSVYDCLFAVFSVWLAETDGRWAEEVALRYFPRPPDHERHRKHHHDGGEPPEQPRVSRGHRQ